MDKFELREGSVKVYDFAMPQNASSYGASKVLDPSGKEHDQVSHSKVRVWRADDPGSPCTITIVYGNGAKAEKIKIDAGALEYPVPMDGLVSVEPDDPKINLCVYADIFPIWAG